MQYETKTQNTHSLDTDKHK